MAELPELNRSELDIMNVLWDQSPQSAREVHDALVDWSGWAYTTTRTLIDRLVDKGVLAKTTSHGLYVYEPAVSKPRGIARLVADFADRVAQVPASQVVSLFADSQSLTAKEIRELRSLLGRLERGEE